MPRGIGKDKGAKGTFRIWGVKGTNGVEVKKVQIGSTETKCITRPRGSRSRPIGERRKTRGWELSRFAFPRVLVQSFWREAETVGCARPELIARPLRREGCRWR